VAEEQIQQESVVIERTLLVNGEIIAVSAFLALTGIAILRYSSSASVGTLMITGGIEVYFTALNRFGYLRSAAIKNIERLSPQVIRILGLKEP